MEGRAIWRLVGFHRLVLILLPAALIGGCQVGVNDDVDIGADETSRGAAVINGRIRVDAGAKVTGDLSTVNGEISVGRGASVRAINTVNGAVRLGPSATAAAVNGVNGDMALEEGARVSGSVQWVNGDISLAPDAEVATDVETVSGTIRLRDARIGGDLTTVTADVVLNGKSVIAGRLRVEDARAVLERIPKIVIGPGSRVEGVLDLRSNAHVYVSNDAQIGGVEGILSESDIVRFSGEEPPTQ